MCVLFSQTLQRRERLVEGGGREERREFLVQESSVFFMFFWTQKNPSLFFSLFFLCVDLGFGVCTQFFFTKVGCLFRYLCTSSLEK